VEENMTHRITRRDLNAGIGAALILPAISPALGSAAFAQGGTPIKIGFSMAQTGALAGAGKQALLGAQIWEDEINGKGGLLGRPVKLIYYDDQTKPDSVPGIYAKLLDVDKVDLVIGPYGTNLVAPAIPSVMGKGKVLVGLFALDANHDFHYPKYFSMLPRDCGRAESEAANRRDYGRGRRVLAQCRRRRPRERSQVRS
jgi:branched-chain amino acid transport system substrate-binding protein